MPNVNYELSPEELKFFETGELPPELVPETPPETPHVVDAVPETPPETPPVVPPVEPDTGDKYLEQLLLQERQRADQVEKALKDMERQLENMKAPKAPDPAEDPFGHLMHKIGELSKQVQDMRDNLSKSAETTEQLTAEQRFMSAMQQSIGEFQKDHADYPQAYMHLRNNRIADLTEAGYTKAQAGQIADQEGIRIAAQALQAGKNIGQVIYGMAKRAGYQVAAPKQDPESKVDQIKKGLKAAETAPNGKPASDLSTAGVDAMSDSELNSAVENQWEKMFGRPERGSIF